MRQLKYRGPAVLFERESELARIAELVDRSVGGQGSTLVIEGPAGIGKTELLAHARQRAAEHGMEVLTARGGELERDLPFVVVRDLLARRVWGAPDSERRQLLAGAAGLAVPVIGGSGEEGDSLIISGGASLSSVLHGLFWLCSNLADRHPLLFAVDDIHWADPSSLRFLSYLAQRIGDLSALLVVTNRTGEPGTDAAAVQAIRGAMTTSVFEPMPLSPAAVAEMLEASYQQRVAPEFSQACHATTGGNPFFVRELVVTLRDEGLGPRAEHAGRVQGIRSERVGMAVRARLERLPAPAIELARAVAVLGTEVELRNAAKLAGIGDEAESAADALAAAELIEPRRPLAFRHPIIRSAIYGTLPPGRRATDHALAARQLSDESASIEQVAGHLVYAEALADAWVVDVLSRAGRSALARGAPEAAITYLQRALVEPPIAAQRLEVLRERGAAELISGNAEAAEQYLAEAFELADPGERAAIAEMRVAALSAAARHDDAVALLQQTIPDVVRHDPDAALRLEAAMLSSASLSNDAYPEAGKVISRVSPLRGETPGERLMLANGAWYAGLFGGRADEAAEFAERALAGGHLLSEARVEAPPFWLCIWMALGAERYDMHLTQVETARREAAAQGSVIGMALALGHRAFNSYPRGLINDSVEDARDSVRNAVAAAWIGGLPGAIGILVLALVESGKSADAARVLGEHGLAGEVPAHSLFDILLVARGILHLDLGQPADALEDLLEVARRQDRRGVETAFWMLTWRPSAARALIALGDRSEARRVADDYLTIARQWGARGAMAAAWRAVAATEDGGARIELLREALTELGDSDARLERMHLLLELGSTLRRMNPRAAREPLLAALDQAERVGAALVAERARDELAATGISRRKRTFLTGPESLTPSERRVATMAGGGLSNPQIAQSLFVTRKTVEKHLANAYMKLGIDSREQLPEALAAPVP